MSRKLELGRQQAEELVDLLEETPDRILHDIKCWEMAAELRAMFGMSTKAQEDVLKNELGL